MIVLLNLLLSTAFAQESGPRRIDFDDQLVRGESAGGAVSLVRRPPRDLAPLVAERVHFLAWTIDPLLAARVDAAPPPDPTPWDLPVSTPTPPASPPSSKPAPKAPSKPPTKPAARSGP